MRKELDEQLCKDFPKIFRDRHGDMRKTAMCFGFEVGDGWYNIIDTACRLIQWQIKSSRDEKARVLRRFRAGEELSDWETKVMESDPVPQVVATQIKEKFGSLRFYFTGGDEFIDGVVRMAEAMSYRTCENCGKPGKVNRGGWLSVRCDDCRLPEDNDEENDDE